MLKACSAACAWLRSPTATQLPSGAGAGGVELALALAQRLTGEVGIALISPDTLPLPGAPVKARALARDALVDAVFQAAEAFVHHQGGETIDVIAHRHKMLAVGASEHHVWGYWIIPKYLLDHLA